MQCKSKLTNQIKLSEHKKSKLFELNAIQQQKKLFYNQNDGHWALERKTIKLESRNPRNPGGCKKKRFEK